MLIFYLILYIYCFDGPSFKMNYFYLRGSCLTRGDNFDIHPTFSGLTRGGTNSLLFLLFIWAFTSTLANHIFWNANKQKFKNVLRKMLNVSWIPCSSRTWPTSYWSSSSSPPPPAQQGYSQACASTQYSIKFYMTVLNLDRELLYNV